MYSLLKTVSNRELLFRHMPSAGTSLLIAEAFFKFGSFTLEAIGFLLTWVIADAIFGVVSTALDHPRGKHQREP